MRVLIVDDVAAVREALRLLLSDEPGLEIAGEAADGEEALRLAVALRPDLVLIDLDMPHMGGLPAIRAMRDLQPPPHIVVMCVYGADDSLRTSALAAGVDNCVEKGANLADVVAVLRDAVRGAKGAESGPAPLQS